ncbi:putative glycolipid-binding domain-containing protein [Fodinicola feengrottensis]|uniref:Glycolipid-binding domain-containing protein n=1 Tax=Fodinicola feengrottensis TaxID=435914 RepID=A0ABN2GCH1_9ACTN
MATILWRGDWFSSSEYCEMAITDAGHRLNGVVLIPMEGKPAHLRYRIDLDYGWRTRSVAVVSEHHLPVVMTSDGEGHWFVSGEDTPAFDGCVDIDLGFSPSTKTFPIRRLTRGHADDLELRANVNAVCLRFPEMKLQLQQQSYERIGLDRWRYGTGDFTAEIDVDTNGFARRFGDLWTAVADA